jgi:hypothetical protein
VILKQQGRDRIMIGFNGTSVAPQTDRVANPLLQDVNEGWLHKIRTHAPERVLSDGEISAEGTSAVYVAAGVEVVDGDATNVATAKADYANLDALAFDVLDLLDPWHRSDTDLVVIVGWKLVKDKYLNLLQAAGDTATEREAAHRILTLPKQLAGKRAVIVPFFPETSLLITSLDNLSVYWQEETRRRQIRDEPALDQIENYESVNEDYVVEDYGRTALVENVVMGKKPARPLTCAPDCAHLLTSPPKDTFPMSLARRKRDRTLAAQTITAAPVLSRGAPLLPPAIPPRQQGPPFARPPFAPPRPPRAQIALRLTHDLRRLKEIRSIDRKIEAKRTMLPEYKAWVEGVVAADAGVGSGTAADVVPTCMVWLIDVGAYGEALDLVPFLLRHRVEMPPPTSATWPRSSSRKSPMPPQGRRTRASGSTRPCSTPPRP